MPKVPVADFDGNFLYLDDWSSGRVIPMSKHEMKHAVKAYKRYKKARKR